METVAEAVMEALLIDALMNFPVHRWGLRAAPPRPTCDARQ
jgi:hypothetical protein